MTATILYDNHNGQWADLAPRMVEFTKFKLYPVKPVITKDIHATLMETKESWAVVFTAGNVVHKPGIVYDIVKHCEQQGSPFAGHILHRNGYYHLHPQFFCVNVEVYQKWAKGLEPKPGTVKSVAVERSEENMHDDYTPLWIRPAGNEETDTGAPDGFASRFIAWLMSQGHQVVNIPWDIRSNKVYSYVDYSHEDIRKFIKDSSYTCQDSGVSQFLDYMRRNLEALDKGFYPINTEPFTKFDRDNAEFKVFAGVCGGIKPAIITDQECFASDTKVILFDISHMAIEWQKWLREHWDGQRNSFEQVFEDFKTKHPDALSQFFGHMGILGNLDWVLNTICNQEEFVAKWNHWLELDVEYHCLDMLTDQAQQQLLNRIVELGAPAYVWTSNLFFMDWQELMHEPGHARRCFDQFVEKIKTIKQPVVLENENYLTYYKI